MRPHLEDPPLEWRGNFGIAIFPVSDFPGQREVMSPRPEFDESRFHPWMWLRSRSGYLGGRGSGIGNGRLLSSPAGRDNQTGYG